MTPGQKLRAWRARLRLTRKQAAEFLKTPEGTYRGWEDDRYTPPPMYELAIACIEHHPPVRQP